MRKDNSKMKLINKTLHQHLESTRVGLRVKLIKIQDKKHL